MSKTSKQNVKALIDEAGEVQQKISKLQKQYKALREQLAGPLRVVFGTERYVKGTSGEYQAILSFDDYDYADPIDVIKKYNDKEISKGIIRTIMSVKVTEARKMLNDELREELIAKKKDEDPTLRISKTDPEE